MELRALRPQNIINCGLHRQTDSMAEWLFEQGQRISRWVRHQVPMRDIYQKIAGKIDEKDRKSERARQAVL